MLEVVRAGGASLGVGGVLRRRVFAGSVSVIALNLALCGTAHAQATEGGTIQEVVVTAQKREQNLQEVPVAVTAVTQDAIRGNRITNVADLTGLAPGLLTRINPGSLGSPSFSLRGVFASASQPSSDRQISIYQDGVYIGATRGSVLDLPDLERIEVLRGPQGTLFGRNATAGAISVVTRDPTGEFKLRQEVTFGNYSQLRTRTSVDLPTVGPFSAYVTYVHDERRGDVRNLGAGTQFDRTSPFTDIGLTTSPKWLGSRNFENVFAAVKFAPVDNFTMIYKFDRSRGVNNPEARVANVLNPTSVVGSMLLGALAAQPAGGGKYGPVVLDPQQRRLNAVNNAWNMQGYLRGYGHNLTTKWQITDNLSVKNITAYRHSVAYGPTSIAGISGLEFTPGAAAAYVRALVAPAVVPGYASLPAATQAALATSLANTIYGSQFGQYLAGYEGNSWGSNWQESTETQVNYDSKRLTLTVGGLYYQAKETNSGLPGMAPNFSFAPTPVLLRLGNVQQAVAKTISVAAYAQGEFHVTDQLDVVLGGRITRDKKVGSLTFGGTFVGSRTSGDVTGAGLTPWQFKKSKPTYSIGVNYRPNSDTMVYAKYSTGFLSGGAVGPFSFQPETVKSPEVGFKSEHFDRRLRVNAALWQATYRHSQSSQGGIAVGQPQLGVVVIDNGTLKAKGLEVEVTAAPVQGLTLSGQLGYTDAKLTSPNPIAAQGKRYKLGGMPKWIGGVNAQYTTQPLYQDAYLTFRFDANYQSKMRSIPDPDVEVNLPALAPFEFLPARWIANTRVSLRDVKIGRANAEIALWSRNLFNTRKAANGFVFGDILYNSNYYPARTYGVDLIVEF